MLCIRDCLLFSIRFHIARLFASQAQGCSNCPLPQQAKSRIMNWFTVKNNDTYQYYFGQCTAFGLPISLPSDDLKPDQTALPATGCETIELPDVVHACSCRKASGSALGLIHLSTSLELVPGCHLLKIFGYCLQEHPTNRARPAGR